MATVRNMFLFFIISMSCSITASAQGEDNVWTFGYHNGLDFNSGSTVFWKSKIISQWPTASISNSDGQLLFFTTGITGNTIGNIVYDANGDMMPNGYPDPRNVKNGSVKISILKSIARQNRYYIFYQSWRFLKYSIVDMSLNNGKGDVVEKEIDLTNCESHCLIQGNDCFTYWLLAKSSYSDSTYMAYKIDMDGIHSPVLSYGLYKSDDINCCTRSDISVSPDGTKIFSERFRKFPTKEYEPDHIEGIGFELSTFDKTTGMVTNPIYISTPNTFDPTYVLTATWSSVFSPNSKLLYTIRASEQNNSHRLELFQYNIESYPDANTMRNSKIKIGDIYNYALRSAPDGKIYSFNGSSNDTGTLGCIQEPNAIGLACNYDEQYMQYPAYSQFPPTIGSDGRIYPGYYSGYVSPGANLIQMVTTTNNPAQTIYLCLPDSKQVSIAGTYDSVRWFDGRREMEHLFTQEGQYWAYKFKDCHIEIDSFRLIAPKVKILEDDTFICRLQANEITLHAQSNMADGFTWNTGDVGDEITVSQSGLYILTQINECGSYSDTIKVTFDDHCDCRPFVPTAFSPNGDGLNDLFRIQSICTTTKFFLSIYNRYGQRVFFSNKIDNSWDGQWKGKNLSDGVYFYTLDFEALGKYQFKMKGDITLIR